MKKLFFIIQLLPFFVFSQHQIQGKIIDASSKTPLPYASIITNTNYVALSNIDGNFYINAKNNFQEITISYIGYQSVTIPITSSNHYLKIKLKPALEKLNEVFITSKQNPALQLIRNVIKHKNSNNAEKSLNSFKFTNYNKILVTANPDSIQDKIDSLYVLKNGKKQFSKVDSSNFKLKKELQNKHLYISEKISEFQFEKGIKTKEVVLASRMAGLKNPIYELLPISFQDFSFYNEFYSVAGTKYINPIATNALKHYKYKILDTVKISNSKSVMVYFKPKNSADLNRIEGVLYIDLKSYALTKAIAELKGIVNVKAIQNYKYYKKDKIWFPLNQQIIIKKGSNDKQISLFGGIIQFQKNANDSIKSTNKNASDYIYFISTSKNINIEINTPLKLKKSSETLQIKYDAAVKPNEFWNTYRTDSIGIRGENTYTYLDSVSKKEGVERKIEIGRNILKGYYPTKYINLNLGKIINLNNYEGLRIGFGGETNLNFSKNFKIEAYGAFGTKDKDFKYSYGTSIKINENHNSWFGVNYTNDLKEAASLDFIAKNTSFSPINPRNLNISKFYNYKTVSTFLNYDIQPNLEAKIQLSAGDYKPMFQYQFNTGSKIFSTYKLTTATFGFQYNPKNEYMNSPIGKLTIKNRFPQISFQITKSFENVLKSDFNFTQLNLRVLHQIKRFEKATTHILVEGGIVFGDVPISHLYNSTPNYTFKNPWRKRITLAGKNSFETMGYNEFISDKFVAIHMKHQLLPFHIGSKFKPQLTLVSRAAIGDIDKPLQHIGIQFKKLNKIYLESGFELNRLFKGFGLSAFYRYGFYKNNEWSDNLALKLTYKFSLGF